MVGTVIVERKLTVGWDFEFVSVLPIRPSAVRMLALKIVAPDSDIGLYPALFQQIAPLLVRIGG